MSGIQSTADIPRDTIGIGVGETKSLPKRDSAPPPPPQEVQSAMDEDQPKQGMEKTREVLEEAKDRIKPGTPQIGVVPPQDRPLLVRHSGTRGYQIPYEAIEEICKTLNLQSKMLGMISRSIAMMFLAYLLGYVSSGIWLVLVLGFCWGYYEFKEMRVNTAEDYYAFKMDLYNQDVLAKVVPELPSWVSFPDFEKVKFLNNAISKLWSRIDKATMQIIRDSVQPLLDQYRPGFLSTLELGQLELGHAPLYISGIKTLETESLSELVLDMDIEFLGKPSLILKAGAVGASLNAVKIQDIEFAARLRVILSPLLDVFPLAGAIAISFIGKPKIDFRLAAMNVNVMGIPGLDSFLINLIKFQLAQMYVWPKKLVIPMVDLSSQVMKKLSSANLDGIVDVEVVEATGLPKTDMFGKCDPFCVVSLGDKKLKTHVIKKTLSPVWNEVFSLDVADYSNDVVEFCIRDKDATTTTKVGSCEVAVKTLVQDKPHDIWLPLKGTSNGKIHLKMTYKSFLGEDEDLTQVGPDDSSPISRKSSETSGKEAQIDEEALKKSAEVSKMIPTLGAVPQFMSASKRTVSYIGKGRLFVTIDRATDLIAADLGGTSDPYAVLSLGNSKFKTKIIKKTLNPVWNAEAKFEVHDLERESLHVAVFDYDLASKDDFLGDVEIALNSLPINKVFENSYKLNGVPSGVVVLKFNLKVLRSDSSSMSPPGSPRVS